MIKVLFVCLGNICRSPMAEAIFKHLVEEADLSDQIEIDSVGTGSYHIGEPAHRGTRRILSKYGISSESIARQLSNTDLKESDYLVAMDKSNVSDIRWQARTISQIDSRLHLLLDFAENSTIRDVPDPYYTGDFESVYRLVRDGCEGLLEHIRQEQKI